MKLSTQMILVLTTVGIISGCFLAGVGILTEKPIQLNREKEIKEAILKVIPQATSTRELYKGEDYTVYAGKDEKGQITGFAIQAEGVGFQDIISLMYGTNLSVSKIYSLTILEQSETPGLGAKITDKDTFLRYWKNKNCTQPLSLHKPAVSSPSQLSPSEVNTITGATISSQSVLDIVNHSLKEVKKLRDKGKLIPEEQNAN